MGGRGGKGHRAPRKRGVRERGEPFRRGYDGDERTRLQDISRGRREGRFLRVASYDGGDSELSMPALNDPDPAHRMTAGFFIDCATASQSPRFLILALVSSRRPRARVT